MIIFKYCSGEKILAGDEVLAGGKKGEIKKIVDAGSPESHHFHCIETGGIVIGFENGDLQVWPWPNEDLVCLKRLGKY